MSLCVTVLYGELYRPLACGDKTVCRDVTSSSGTSVDLLHVETVNLGLVKK